MPTSNTDRPAQTIEQLTARYQQLNEKKIKAQSDLQHAQDRLDELKKKAMQEYHTDDLAELKQQLADMKSKNEKDRASYQASLDGIEADLSQIDEDYRSAGITHD